MVNLHGVWLEGVGCREKTTFSGAWGVECHSNVSCSLILKFSYGASVTKS